MRLDLNEPVTLPRWHVLGMNISLMIFALIALIDQSERASPVRYILTAALVACLLAMIMMGLALLKPVSGKK